MRPFAAFGDFCRHSINRVIYRHDHAAHRTDERRLYILSIPPYCWPSLHTESPSFQPSKLFSCCRVCAKRSRAPRFAQFDGMLGVPGKHPTQALSVTIKKRGLKCQSVLSLSCCFHLWRVNKRGQRGQDLPSSKAVSINEHIQRPWQGRLFLPTPAFDLPSDLEVVGEPYPVAGRIILLL